MPAKIKAVIEAIQEKVAILKLDCEEAPPLHNRQLEWPLEHVPNGAGPGETFTIDVQQTPLRDYFQAFAKTAVADMLSSANPPVDTFE